MKISLKKDWYYTGYSGYVDFYKKGTVLYNNKRTKNHRNLQPSGWIIPHFYCYNQGEIIPEKYLKIEK